jgi:septin 3/9/12
MATTVNAPATVYPRSHVGFDSITSQIERKLLKRGFQFNVMVVGECNRCHPWNRQAIFIDYLSGIGQTGLGKSTLINTIFASHLINSKGRLTPNEPVRSTTEIQTVSHSTLLECVKERRDCTCAN